MKKTLSVILSVVMVLTALFAFSSCGQKEMLVRFVDKDGNDLDLAGIVGASGSGTGTGTGTGTAAKAGTGTGTGTAAAASGGVAATTAAGGAAAAANAAGSAATTAAAAQAGEAAAESALPSSPADILAKYTSVMNQFKTDAPAFNKVEYQALPEEYRNLGKLGNVILGLAESYLTSQEKAEASPQVHNSGDSMENVVVNKNKAGCLLTDTGAIKSAACVSNGDGTDTITIVLNSELNPEPTPEGTESPVSSVGAMFNPMSKAGVDVYLEKISAITVNSFDMNYNDCTATLTFDESTGKVQSLTEIMNVDVTANVTGLKIITIDGGGRLVNTMKIYNIQY